MDTNKIMYALVTKKCNLSCNHCDVYRLEDDWNEEKFLDTLRKHDGLIIIFGGECSLYPERIRLLMEDPDIKHKISSISTNLLILNDELIQYYKKIKYIGTSWNPGRFTDIQYETWIDNIKKLSDCNIGILITLTDSLFEYDFDKFMNILYELDDTNNVVDIKFEHYVGPGTDRSYFRLSDDFLCKVYDNWNMKMKLDNIIRVQRHYNDCSRVQHLNPDGGIHIGCCHAEPISFSNDCLLCGNVDRCKPCQLQKYCTVPYNFTKKVYDDIENGKIKAIDCFSETKLDLEEIRNVINR